jgi:4-nitrophenyl phosphatase
VAVILCDMDGVLYRGDHVVPGAPECIRELRHAGHRFFFITNNSSRLREEYVAKLARMGIEATVDEVLTSTYVMAHWLRVHGRLPRQAYVIGSPAVVTELVRAGAGASRTYRRGTVDAVVCGIDVHFTYQKLANAQEAILAGAAFYGTNRDLMLPAEDRVYPGNGALLAAIEACTGRQAMVFGKPEPYLYTYALELAGANPADALVVGDNLATDIAAAKRCGLRSVLVLTGLARAAEVAALPQDARPDYVVDDLPAMARQVLDLLMPAQTG